MAAVEACGTLGRRSVGVQPIQQPLHVGHGVDLAGHASHLGTHRIPLQVPGEVLAERGQAVLPAVPLHQEPDVAAHDICHHTQPRRPGHRIPPQRCLQLPEDPGAPQTAPSDHDTVASGVGHHCGGVTSGHHITVAEHRDRSHRVLQLCDRAPACRGSVVVERRPRVECHRGCSLGLGDAPGVHVGEVLVVDAHAELHGHRYRPARLRSSGIHRRTDHAGEQAALVRERRPTAVAGDLRSGATEVEIEVVDHVLAHQPPDGLGHIVGVGAVELQ